MRGKRRTAAHLPPAARCSRRPDRRENTESHQCHSLVLSFSHSLSYSHTHTLTHSLSHSLIHCPFTYSFALSFTHTLDLLLIQFCSFIHLFSISLTYSHIHRVCSFASHIDFFFHFKIYFLHTLITGKYFVSNGEEIFGTIGGVALRMTGRKRMKRKNENMYGFEKKLN